MLLTRCWIRTEISHHRAL